jgi:hypothetical protein
MIGELSNHRFLLRSASWAHTYEHKGKGSLECGSSGVVGPLVS